MDALARKRRIANRLRRNVASKAGDDDGDDLPAPHFEPAMGVDRDRGGRGGREQPHDDHTEIEPCRPLPRIQATELRIVAPPRGRFDAIAEPHAEPGRESERADAIALAWEGEMRGLRMRPPNAPRTAEMLELSLDLLLIQRRIGPIPVGTLAKLRESATATQAALRADRLSDRTIHDGMQRFNLLFPLLWLQAGMPRTTARLDRAIAALLAIRNGLPSNSTATSEANNEPTPATRTASSK
ncbi:hypothetical protein ACV22V_31620 [Burkholderia sp. AW33-5]